MQITANCTAGVPLVVTSDPVIGGDPVEGQRLTLLSLGSCSGNPTTSIPQWMSDGIDVVDATDSFYDVLSSDVGVGEITVRVDYAKPGFTASSGPSNAIGPIASITPDPVVSTQPIYFGALDANPKIGARLVNSSGEEVDVVSVNPTPVSGSLAGFTPTVVGGRVAFTGGTGAPDGVVLACTLATGEVVNGTVTSLANTRMAGNQTELNAWLALTWAQRNGTTLILRYNPAIYDIKAKTYGKFETPSGQTALGVTIKGERTFTWLEELAGKLDRRPILNGIDIGGTTASGLVNGNVTFEHLSFFEQVAVAPKVSNQMPGAGNSKLFGCGGSAPVANLVWRNCKFDQGVPDARNVLTRPTTQYPCGNFRGAPQNVTIEDCEFHRVITAIRYCGDHFLFQLNRLHDLYEDGLKPGPESGDFTRTDYQILDNDIWDFCGDHGYHQDFIQWQGALNSTGTVTGVVVRGNLLWLGKGDRMPSWPNGVPEAAARTGTTTVGQAENGKIIRMDTTDQAAVVKVGDPQAGTANFIVQWLDDGNFSFTLDPNGEVVRDIDNAVNITTPTVFTQRFATFQLIANGGANQWELRRMGPVYQMSQKNIKAVTDVDYDFNIYWHRENLINHDTAAAQSGNWRVANVSSIPEWPDTTDREVTSRPFWGVGSRGNRFIRLADDASVSIRASIFGAHFSTPVAQGVLANILATARDLNYVWSAVTALFPNVPNPAVQVFKPANRDEAIDFARPAVFGVGGGLAPPGYEADDHYNFGQHAGEPRGFRRTTPWYVTGMVVTPTSGGFSAAWTAPGYFGHGAITSYKGRYRVNGGAWVNASGRTSPWAASGLGTANTVEVQILAVNGNGDGVWTPATIVTL